jgi:hypothetical protein
MLAEQLGEEQFLAMLKEIARRANFRALDTETVLAALAKMSGRNLDAFTRSFVYGVGYPEIHYEYVSEPTEGGFMLRGAVHQVARGFRRDRLVRAAGGGFDVTPSFREYQPVEGANTVIPGVVPIDENVGEKPGAWNPYVTKAEQVHWFNALVKASGSDTSFGFKLAKKPKALHLDPRTMLPTLTFNQTLEPKESLTEWADALRSVGQSEAARAAYGKALLLKADVDPDQVPALGESEVARKTDIRNAWIHLELAELAIDDGRFDDAATELEDPTISIITRVGMEGAFRRKLLRARMAIHSGDAATAFKLLNGLLALDVLQKETDTVFDDLHRNKLNGGSAGFARDYLVYAAAAHATGHEDICREAASEAKRRGGDASLLDELHAGIR